MEPTDKTTGPATKWDCETATISTMDKVSDTTAAASRKATPAKQATMPTATSASATEPMTAKYTGTTMSKHHR